GRVGPASTCDRRGDPGPACRRGCQTDLCRCGWHSRHESASHGDYSVPVTPSTRTRTHRWRAVSRSPAANFHLMDIASFQALTTPSGQALLGEASGLDVSEDGLLTTASKLRERHDPGLVSAALTQVRLRRRARAKFGVDADRMCFTQAGLEQATRASVALYRARRFAEKLPGARVLELGCGIGGDLIARARMGLAGEGVELDPLTAEVARANIAAQGLEDLVSVRVGDATKEDLHGFGAVFSDPGRRTARGRVFDPRAYEPPLDVVLNLACRTPAACVKVAPGIP